MNNIDLKEKLNKYYKITKQIEQMMNENKYNEIGIKLDERQFIIDSICEEDRDIASKIYNDMNIHKVDSNIRKIMAEHLNEIKQEIKEYRKSKTVNSIYTRNSKEKLNIFSKKA